MPPDPEILFAPGPERLATTNAWAFLHWLRHTGRAHPAAPAAAPSWDSLRRFLAAAPDRGAAALAAFLRCDPADPELFPLGALALHADLRPDDRLLLAGVAADAPPWPLARRLGTTVLHADTQARGLLAAAATQRATVLAAPAAWLADAAFPNPSRPDLAPLRTLFALGGPMAPEARARVHAWIKADAMLLADAGGTVWGNPLSPVLRRPPPESALFGSRRSHDSSRGAHSRGIGPQNA